MKKLKKISFYIRVNRDTNIQQRHQRLVRHRINDRADDRLQLIAARDPAVHQVRDTGVGEEAKGPGVGVVQYEVAD